MEELNVCTALLFEECDERRIVVNFGLELGIDFLMTSYLYFLLC